MQQERKSNALDGNTPMVRYERELTIGAIGSIWLGRLVEGAEAGRTVLLRRISRDLLEPEDVAGLRQVAQAYCRVRHPSLVKLLGVLEQDHDVVTVSEHLDGVRLGDLMRNAIDRDTPLPATVAVRIVLDAARATVKAHRLAAEAGLFPAERLFVPEGVFVASFGGTLLSEIGVLAALLRCTQGQNSPELLAQLAPEELSKTAQNSPAPEVFSLGVLLWEALANRSLFSRESVKQTRLEVSELPIRSLENVERCGLPTPDALADVVRVATNRHPGLRFATVQQFVEALEQLPVHFIATEHDVASALREQAADLLRTFHADEAQTSLTLAFSEVPASRLSTRPPPDGGHNWEPPTVSQRQLLAGHPIVLAGAAPLQLVSTARAVAPVSAAAPDVRRQRRVGRFALLALMSGVVFGAVWGAQKWVNPRIRARIGPETVQTSNRANGKPTAQGLQPSTSDLPEHSTTENPVMVRPDGAASPRLSDSKTTHARPASVEVPVASSLVESPAPPAMAKKPGAAYRPHQIAPYRPKGI